MRLAGFNIKVNTDYGQIDSLVSEYIISKPINNDVDISISISYNDIMREAEANKHEDMIKKTTAYRSNGASLYEFNALHKKLAEEIPLHDAFLMHGAVVAKDNNAYMFTAPSGIGKTTRIRLWREIYPDSIIVNGDKPIVKVEHNRILVCGTPWCGKERWNTNTMVPLRAVFLLERVNTNEETIVEEISFEMAFQTLLKQIYQPINLEALKKTISLLASLNGKVKIYKYLSSPTLESVIRAYEVSNKS